MNCSEKVFYGGEQNYSYSACQSIRFERMQQLIDFINDSSYTLYVEGSVLNYFI